MMKKNPHVGSTLDDLLREDGALEEVEARAQKRVLARQLEQLTAGPSPVASPPTDCSHRQPDATGSCVSRCSQSLIDRTVNDLRQVVSTDRTTLGWSFANTPTVLTSNDETPVGQGFRKRAGDRDRTGDVQLGKLLTFAVKSRKPVRNPRRTAPSPSMAVFGMSDSDRFATHRAGTVPAAIESAGRLTHPLHAG